MSPRTIQRIRKALLLCLTLFISTSVQAAFITDKVVVNVHAERFGQGAVLKTLSSGSSVTVLMNDGQYSRVRTNDNITGWVESKFISNEKPTQLEYLELLNKTKKLEADLKAAKAEQTSQPEAGGEGIDIAELAELRKRAADAGWMRVELKKARDRAGELEVKLKSNNKNVSSSEEEITQLKQKNKMLEERLAAAILVNEQQDITEQPEAASLDENTNPGDQARNNDGWTVKIGWFLGSIVVALIIGLVVGMTWLDKRIRQRHGGFRIY